MSKIKYFAAALVFAVCAGNVPANKANADSTPDKDRSGRTYKGCTRNARKERIRGLEVQGREVLGHISIGQVCRLWVVWQAR